MASRKPRPSILVFVATILLTGGLGAQEGRVPELRRTLENLGDSSRVQLLAPGLVVTDGLFLGFHEDSLLVSEADAVVVVGLDEIEGLAIRGNRWRSLALQAAGVGLVAGFMAGYMKGSYECGDDPDWCDTRAWHNGVNWSLSGALTGAVVGAAIGTRVLRWRAVFP